MIKNLKVYWKKFGQIFKNFMYNLSYQILSLILPIITVPYITRVLSQEVVGLNTVIQANCTYFALIGMMGVSILGPREIAKHQEDLSSLKDVFCKIYNIQFFFHIFVLFLYGIYCWTIHGTMLHFLYLIYLISSATDISWFFMGIEDFKSISVRNLIVKLAAFILLFIFVQQDDDIGKYVLTLYLPQLIMNIYMWKTAVKNKKIIYKIGCLDGNYLKESISLFIPNIASSIYTILDKTILGIFDNYSSVAVYAQAQVIVRLTLAVIPSFSRVMIPRISNSIYKKDHNAVLEYMRMSAKLISFITFLIFFGVLAGAQLFVDWYMPVSYQLSGTIIRICSPIIIAVSGSNLIAIQFLIPLGQQKKYTISIFTALFANLFLNFLLTPKYGIYGVCIGSVIAEWMGFILQIIFAKRFLNLKEILKKTYIYIIAGTIMFLILMLIKPYFKAELLQLVMFAIIGVIVYISAIIFQKKCYSCFKYIKI